MGILGLRSWHNCRAFPPYVENRIKDNFYVWKISSDPRRGRTEKKEMKRLVNLLLCIRISGC